ncbi:MAG TPA: alanine racemase [Patescibacteria group bacterium]|nr:alanine racemase [Patescibacteria group bacterium]
MNNPLTWVEISKSALNHNLQQFKKIIGPKVRLMAVVKSNAYGHGSAEISKLCDLSKEVEIICTVNLEEALALRKLGVKKPILVLSYYDLDKKELAEAIKKNIRLVVYQDRQFKYLNQIASRLKKKALVHFKVDTGTSRLGALVNKSLPEIKKLLKYKSLQLEGLFTHYASAEEINQGFTIKQTSLFYNLIKQLEKNNIFIPLKHAACSAAILMNRASHFDAVRPGISLFGLWSLEDGREIRKKYPLKPVLCWKTKVIQVKQLAKGQTVGYGRTYQAVKQIEIAVLPVGYFEGYDRKLSGRGEVLIKGTKCKVLGRVCMNLIMVDVTGKNVKVNDEAVLIGKQGKEELTAEALAKKIKTINYEVVTRINSLLPRKIIT